MMELIYKLEKSRAFWFLIIISLLFFLLRLPSLIEPRWYGDEGVYQVVGMALNNGQMLYSGIWDNKPPLLYLTYALFQGDQYSARLASLIFGMLTMWTFFFLSQKLFNNLRASIITTSVFTFLFATPFIEGNIANAENFMLLPIVLAGLLIYSLTTKQNHKHTTNFLPLFLVGLLLGVAFLFKIVAIFDFAAFLVFLLILSFPETGKVTFSFFKKTLTHFLASALPYTLGFLLPLIITISYFAANQALEDFIHAAFSGMFGYVSYGNTFIIPQGLLFLKLLVLATFIVFMIFKRKTISHPTLFILVWLAFALFNAFFAQRSYTHYLLVLVPSFSLLVGLIVNEKIRKQQLQFLFLLILVLAAVFTTFKTYPIKKTFLYYANATAFIAGQKNVTDYQAFFDRKTPRDYHLASFLRMNTKPLDRIFVWGDSPQIYSLSQTLPINKYTVAYHIRQSKEGFHNTQESLNTIRPKYVIILYEAPSFPFQLDNYISKMSLGNAYIYERDH